MEVPIVEEVEVVSKVLEFAEEEKASLFPRDTPLDEKSAPDFPLNTLISSKLFIEFGPFVPGDFVS